MGVEVNEISAKAKGGTELMMQRVADSFPSDFLDQFQIIPSRVRDLDSSKYRIYWCHDLAEDPATNHLANGGWNRFHRLVFVSHWQRETYMRRYGIPYSKTVVLQNAIDPIEVDIDAKFSNLEPIRLIYHTTPHRGLRILAPVFDKLTEEFGDKIHLDVFSSFKIYGWDERDKEFADLFPKIEAHPQMTYHGYQPNEVVREALAKAHIFAYPSIWQETSCISLMEAMSAGCICVHPDYAALPETAANWTTMYSFHEDWQAHANMFYHMLRSTILSLMMNKETPLMLQLKSMKGYVDFYYSWQLRKVQWEGFLRQTLTQPLETADEDDGDTVFVYQT